MAIAPTTDEQIAAEQLGYVLHAKDRNLCKLADSKPTDPWLWTHQKIKHVIVNWDYGLKK